ncbi:MAG: lipopolysaccharide biosynthesis protein [Alphaproteobacteria bacterium]
MRSGVRRDVAMISLGHGLFAISQGVIAMALAKLAGLEALAAFGLALAVSNPLYFLASMGLRPAIASDASRRFAFSDCWRARLATTFVAGLLMLVAGIAIHGNQGFSGAAPFILFAGVKTVDAGFDLLYGLRQRDGQTRAVAISFAWRATLGPAALAAGLYGSGGALWAGLAGWACALVAIFVFTELGAVRRALASEPTRTEAVTVARHAWPLGLSVALAALETAIPRYVIDWRMAPGALGYFTGIFFFFQAALVVGGAFSNAAAPHFGRAYAARNSRRFNKLLILLTGTALALGCLGVVAAHMIGPWLLATIFTPDFAPYAPVLTLIAIAATLRFISSLLQFALIAAGRFKAPLKVHIFLVVIAAAASIPMIDAHGLIGAAYTLIAVATIQTALYIVMVKRLPWPHP